jgi:uncharacterized membrane protein YebE (DUF533 family)
VDAEERELIYKRMKDSGISTLRQFFLKMALNGRIFNVEMTSIANFIENGLEWQV